MIIKAIVFYQFMKQQSTESQFNSFQTVGGNIIWAGALSLAWSELKNTFVKENIQLKVKNEVAEKIIYNFNHASFTKNDISPECIYIKSGYGKETVDLINKEVKMKFQQKNIEDLKLENISPTDIISYAYLFKKLEFQVIFSRKKEAKFIFNKLKVQSIYADTLAQKKQVFCYHYKNEQNFIVSIKTKVPKDLIFFIKSQQKMSLDDAFTLIQKHQNHKSEPLGKQDVFEMPVININCSRSVKELVGKQFNNSSMAGYVLSEIVQVIKLNIDEAGVKLENEGVIRVMKTKVLTKQQPKLIILNRRFWIIMKQVKRHPYAGFLITNPHDG